MAAVMHSRCAKRRLRSCNERVSSKRAMKAFVFIVAALLLLLTTGLIHEANAESVHKGSTSYVSQIRDKTKDFGSISAALGEMGFIELTAENLPEWFSREIVDLSKSYYAIADKDMSLVCLSFAKDSEDVASQLLGDLEVRGWTAMQSGQTNLYTFIKQEGECRWLMAEVDPIGEETSVVLHIGRT